MPWRRRGSRTFSLRPEQLFASRSPWKDLPNRAMFGMRTMTEHLAESLDRPRLNAGVLAVFAASALLSAAVGLYGLITLIVVARTREIGVRLAVGATPLQVVRQVLGEALRP